MKNIAIFFVILLLSCSGQVNRISKPLLGTIINLTIISDEQTASGAASAAFSEIERIEDLMSPYRESSDVYRINRSSGRPVRVSDETLGLIALSNKISDETGGSFDITFASLSKL